MTTISFTKYSTPFGVEYKCLDEIFTCWDLREVKAFAADKGFDLVTVIEKSAQRTKSSSYPVPPKCSVCGRKAIKMIVAPIVEIELGIAPAKDYRCQVH